VADSELDGLHSSPLAPVEQPQLIDLAAHVVVDKGDDAARLNHLEKRICPFSWACSISQPNSH
jgi:hypothetical protein